MKVRAHVIISGVVQGVNFRRHIKIEAEKNKVNGWVRNLIDGRVEAVFEGEEQDVRNMIEFCKLGPPNAVVTDIRITWENIKGEEGFEIRY
ncbi:MAG: acylphosphatase [Candidatus Aenigmatarchaeota archaeon]